MVEIMRRCGYKYGYGELTHSFGERILNEYNGQVLDEIDLTKYMVIVTAVFMSATLIYHLYKTLTSSKEQRIKMELKTTTYSIFLSSIH